VIILQRALREPSNGTEGLGLKTGQEVIPLVDRIQHLGEGGVMQDLGLIMASADIHPPRIR
jgi:hypothetical protein